MCFLFKQKQNFVTIIVKFYFHSTIVENCKKKWKLLKDGHNRKIKNKTCVGDVELSFLNSNNNGRLVHAFSMLIHAYSLLIAYIYISRKKCTVNDDSQIVKKKKKIEISDAHSSQNSTDFDLNDVGGQTATIGDWWKKNSEIQSANDVSCKCKDDSLEIFFRSISSTMRNFPSLEIAQMKLLISTAVGNKELQLLQQRAEIQVQELGDIIAVDYEDNKSEALHEETLAPDHEFVSVGRTLPSGIHRVLRRS